MSPVISSEWADTAPVPDDAGLTSGGAYPDAGAGFAATFFLNGTTPKAGDIFANPDLAATLQRLADLGCDDGFYGADSVTAMAITPVLKIEANACNHRFLRPGGKRHDGRDIESQEAEARHGERRRSPSQSDARRAQQAARDVSMEVDSRSMPPFL